MTLLSLFPLNTVLFPGMPLTLHIFEERYKLMINRCIDEQRPFGVVLIQAGSEVEGAGPAAQPHMVGCMAHILQVQRVGMGRMNIVAVGRERFRVQTMHYTEPYLTGTVEELKNLHELVPNEAGHEAGVRLRPWVERYLTAIASSENVEFDSAQLPDDTMHLTYLAAALLRVAVEEKQALLDMDDETRLIQSVTTLYRKEATLLKVLLMQSETTRETQIGVFSIN